MIPYPGFVPTRGHCRGCDRKKPDSDAEFRRCAICGSDICDDCWKKVYQLEREERDDAWRRGRSEYGRRGEDQPARPYRCEDCYLYPKVKK